MNKNRLFFYGTIIPLVVLNLYTYSQYKDQEKTIENTYRVSNRQIEVINMGHRETIERLRREYEDTAIKRRQ